MARQRRSPSTSPADRDPETSIDAALSLLMNTVERLETARAIAETTKRTTGTAGAHDDVEAAVDGPQLLAVLTELRRLRDHLARWEPIVIAAARDRGVTWTDIAPALGLSSRQAAESRYLRLKHEESQTSANTGEQRVRATRDRRSGDRAVADWARDNAAVLRGLAGQIAAALHAVPGEDGRPDHLGHDLNDSAHLVGQVTTALGSDDVTELVDPLFAAQPALSTTHPDLAREISALAASAEQVRATDLRRRTSAAQQ